MARVQLIIPDDDWSRFVHQALMEGMTYSAWLREAAREKLEDRQKGKRFATSKEVQEFFQACVSMGGPDVEPDWSEHVRIIEQSRAGGRAGP